MSVPGLSDAEVKALQDEFGISEAEIAAEAAKVSNSQGIDETGYPVPPRKDDLLRFFRDVRGESQENYGQISRSGNLNDNELGRLPLTQRFYLDLGLFCETENLDNVSTFLRSRANIWSDTSLSRKGFLLKLPVSNLTKRQDLGTPKTTVKRSLFGGEQVVREGMED